MKKKFIILAVVFIGLVGVWLLYSYSFIEMTVANSGDNQVTLALKNQSSGKVSVFQHDGGTTKKLVRRAEYEIIGSQSGNSGLKIVSAGGFFSTKAVSLSLKPEKQRMFIADNPRFCMDYVESVLLSYNCSDAFDNIQIHTPATSKQASYIKKVPHNLEANIVDTLDTSEGYFALVREPDQGESTGSQFKLFRLTAALSLSNGIPLESLAPDLSYRLLPYDKGFIAYDTNYRDINYFSSSLSKPQEIKLSSPKDSALKPYDITTRGSTVAIAYSDNTEGEVADVHSEGTKRVRNEIHITRNGESFSIELRGQLSKIDLCGENKLCVLHDKDLAIYDISDRKPDYLYRLTSVEAIERSSDTLLAARYDGIFELDIDDMSGYNQYTFGEYTYCGISTDSSGYTVCMTNRRKDKVALRINPKLENSDSIDKKINDLLGVPSIKELTVNGKFIHITPNLGKLIFLEDMDSFGYDPAKKAEVREQIQGKLNALQLEKSGYSIILTLNLR